MDAFLQLFGNIKLESIILFVAALIFIRQVYVKIRDYIIDRHEVDVQKDRQVKECLDQISKYPTWRQQSIDKQKEFTDAINALKTSQEKYAARLEEIETGNRQRELNKLRDRLIQSYHYFSSPDKNPSCAWSEMEADAFWRMFKDYEDLGGDGFIHSEVEPSMRSLETIPMTETERITEIMHNRK